MVGNRARQSLTKEAFPGLAVKDARPGPSVLKTGVSHPIVSTDQHAMHMATKKELGTRRAWGSMLLIAR